ncbi:hypothetical protein HPB48_004534 [Haemaphysalis longicornis]|uniref:ISXO2-like transposase domain-containing protein n=1 Tax=Haemaphysalis longicornis TaxID=44386 RepID=A0A9J6FQ83_HAELO|nr:hypothetical protein HPB48_004534 [Haemaphysalis longicornis]
MQGAATLGKNIAESIPPGTTIDCDKWAAYNCIPNLVDAARVDTNYVCESTTQTTLLTPTPMPWQTPMQHLVRNGYKVTPALLECHLPWLWWLPMNRRQRCKDPFLRPLEAIARQYPA